MHAENVYHNQQHRVARGHVVVYPVTLITPGGCATISQARCLSSVQYHFFPVSASPFCLFCKISVVILFLLFHFPAPAYRKAPVPMRDVRQWFAEAFSAAEVFGIKKMAAAPVSSDHLSEEDKTAAESPASDQISAGCQNSDQKTGLFYAICYLPTAICTNFPRFLTGASVRISQKSSFSPKALASG